MTPLYLIVFGIALVLSFVITKYVRDAALRHNWVSKPASDRHVHRTPLPRLGGVAIFLAFLLTLSATLLLGLWYPAVLAGIQVASLWKILVPGTLIFVLGVIDDIRPLNAYAKFTGQAIAGAILFAGGLRVLDLPLLFGHNQFSWFLSLPLTILWVLAITNAFNLIDGLDGLAAGSALFSTLVVFVVSLFSHTTLVSLMTLVLAGCILGFLRYNFNPATIFLGDCGSLFIGFMLSALALKGTQKSPTIVAVAIPVVSFGLPILETALSILRRLISGRPVFIGDREHIHHKLLERGLSQRKVVIILYAVSAGFAMLSLFLLLPTGSTIGLVLAVLGIGIWIGVQHLGYLEFGELRRMAQRTMEQRQIVINNLSIRRATEELKVVRNYKQLWPVLHAAFANNDFDSFELRLPVSASAVGDTGHFRVSPGTDNDVLLAWSRNHHTAAEPASDSWRLTLELISSDDFVSGSLTLRRGYSSHGLQLDINLLTSEFPSALAGALQRAQMEIMEPLPAGDPDFAAAQAG